MSARAEALLKLEVLSRTCWWKDIDSHFPRLHFYLRNSRAARVVVFGYLLFNLPSYILSGWYCTWSSNLLFITLYEPSITLIVNFVHANGYIEINSLILDLSTPFIKIGTLLSCLAYTTVNIYFCILYWVLAGIWKIKHFGRRHLLSIRLFVGIVILNVIQLLYSLPEEETRQHSQW